MKKHLRRIKAEIRGYSYVRAVSSRTDRPYKAVLRDMRAAKDRYGVSFKDYDAFGYEACSTEADFEDKLKAVKSEKRRIKRLCEKTGWSKEKAAEELAKAKEKYGIEAKTYINAGLYALDDEGIAKYLEKKQIREKTRNPRVKIVADRTGKPYKEVLRDMNDAWKKYGVTFAQYASLGGEKCSTEEDFNRLKEASKRRRNDRRANVIKKLRDATGWTEEQTAEKIKHVEDTFGLSAQQYYSNGYYLLDDDEIKEAIDAKKERREEVMARVVAESGWNKRRVKNHMGFAASKYGIDATDYMLIKAWRFSDEEMSRLACLSTTRQLGRKYNEWKAIGILANKLEFDKVFSDCIMRRFWTNDNESDYESYCAFWDGMDEAMVKPLTLFQARGIRKMKRPADLQKSFDELKDSPQVLLEEVVKQHPDVSAIYPQAVNTVRMVTLLKDGEFHVLCSFMKFGQGGSVVDNMIAGGMIAGVDEVNGIIETSAVDRDGNVHEFHPDTGKAIKGFKIPEYDKVLELTEKALRKAPGINFVGWDVAICDGKAVIIEGNTMPGLMAYQLPYLQEPLNEPKLYKFEPYL